jgi:hypothetical protein
MPLLPFAFDHLQGLDLQVNLCPPCTPDAAVLTAGNAGKADRVLTHSHKIRRCLRPPTVIIAPFQLEPSLPRDNTIDT